MGEWYSLYPRIYGIIYIIIVTLRGGLMSIIYQIKNEYLKLWRIRLKLGVSERSLP